MTLKATLAERLGLESAADAKRRETDEFLWIGYERRSSGLPDETAADRALRRVGLSQCSALIRTLPEPRLGAWCEMHWRETRGTLYVRRVCGSWPAARHTLVMAPALRAMRSGRATCAGEEG